MDLIVLYALSQGCLPSLTGGVGRTSPKVSRCSQSAHHTSWWWSGCIFEFLLSSVHLPPHCFSLLSCTQMIITYTIWLLVISIRLYSGFPRVNLSLSSLFYSSWCPMSFWICGLVLITNLGKYLCLSLSSSDIANAQMLWVCVCTQSYMILCDPMDCNPQDPLAMEFSRQKYRCGLPVHPPGYLPHQGIKPTSPSLAGGVFTTEPPGKHYVMHFLIVP